MNSGWQSRGDGWHWDHTDGCFVEKDGGMRVVFVLYDKECKKIGRAKTLPDLYRIHSRLHSSNAPAAPSSSLAGGNAC